MFPEGLFVVTLEVVSNLLHLRTRMVPDTKIMMTLYETSVFETSFLDIKYPLLEVY